MSDARHVETPEWLTLSPDETVNFRARPSKNLLLAGVGTGMVLLILVSVVVAALGDIATGRVLSFLVVAILAGIYALVHRWEYAVTSDRACVATGLRSQDCRSVNLDDVEEVRVDRSRWQRLVNVGDLSFVTEEETLRFAFLHSPHRVQERVLTSMGAT